MSHYFRQRYRMHLLKAPVCCGRVLAAVIGASIAITTPGLDAAGSARAHNAVDVLDIQRTVAAFGAAGSGGAVDGVGVGLLGFQQGLADTPPAGAPAEAAYDVSLFWGTVPSPTRLNRVLPAWPARLLEALPGKEHGTFSGSDCPEFPMGATARRDRFLFHLTANAPPAMRGAF
jgi:hypothetical protein